jgi:phosphoketolase
VPLADVKSDPAQLAMLETWMRSYGPDELFDADGRLIQELAALAPTGDRRMGANPHANGGKLLLDLDLPDFRSYALAVTQQLQWLDMEAAIEHCTIGMRKDNGVKCFIFFQLVGENHGISSSLQSLTRF